MLKPLTTIDHVKTAALCVLVAVCMFLIGACVAVVVNIDAVINFMKG